MPRANRNFTPGLIWHITHRCHKKEFLLKFRRDKLRWMWWMHQAILRYGLTILNYMITSNHVHLLGMAADRTGSIASPFAPSLQLVQSRVAQEFNLRKNRHGAFWEDRYHATAVESGAQLVTCLTYIDMNMVRAGVVRHPKDWQFCGYDELLRPSVRPRSKLVNVEVLTELVGAGDAQALKVLRSEWIEQAIRKGRIDREPMWTESVAVGSREYLRRVQAQLGTKLKSGEIVSNGDILTLRRTKNGNFCISGAENDENGGENG